MSNNWVIYILLLLIIHIRMFSALKHLHLLALCVQTEWLSSRAAYHQAQFANVSNAFTQDNSDETGGHSSMTDQNVYDNNFM